MKVSRRGRPKEHSKEFRKGKIDKRRLLDFKCERENIRIMQDRLKELILTKDYIRGVRYGFDKVQEGSGVQRDVFGMRLIQIDELIEFYDKKLEALLEEERIIEEWLAGLKILHSTAIRMVFFEGRTQQETADMLNVHPNTINYSIGRFCY